MLTDHVIDFIHCLRRNGHIIGIQEVTDIIDTISTLNNPNAVLSRHCLQTLCCRNKEEWQQFDSLFNAYWFENQDSDTSEDTSTRKPEIASTTNTNNAGIAGTSKSQFESINSMQYAGAGKQNTIAKADFRFLNDASAMREAEDMAEKLALRLKSRTRMHKKITSHGNRMDLRHTIRQSLGFGGIPVKPVYSIKNKKPPHIVLLHDVSHSMNWNNPLLFRFARGLIRACNESDAFVFHTKLFCVSDIYREKSIAHMREKLESKNHLWLGGTCIAKSIHQFNQEFAKSVLKSHSIVIIISDGFDTDAPDKLASALNFLNSHSKQILWLNPMLVHSSEPDSDNMRSALPYVDHFLPAHSVDALRKVIHTIKL